MADLLTPRDLELTRYTLSDYLQWRVDAVSNPFAFAPFPPVVTYNGNRVEQVEDNYTALATYAYRGSSVVAACMRVRRDLFRQARFCWREITETGPGRISRTDELRLLDRPWPNGTTGELLTRMITDVDLCGNSFVANEGDRLRWLRPDWVSIVLTGDPLVDDRIDVLGYVYTPGGADVDNGVAYEPDEICHWAPDQDPLAFYRGMSWVSKAVDEIHGDRAATTHKLSFFRHGATLGPIIRVPAGVSKEQFREFIAESEAAHVGADNAYRPFYVGGGADVSLSMADFRQLDLKAVQGGYETRVAAVAGVHPVLVGLSEGLQGSSLNAGNFAAARRATAEMTLFALWQDVCGALEAFFTPPDDAELWIREKDIPFLREERKDQAEITKTRMLTIEAGVRAGYKPDALVRLAETDDVSVLIGQHSNLFSVQLQPANPNGGVPAQPPDFGALREPIAAGVAETRRAITAGPDDDEVAEALADAFDEIERRYNPDQPRIPKGFEGGGRFRNLADRIFDALEKWVKGEGDDDPLDAFDREQLRKTAKVMADKARAAGDDERAARLTPRRGASSDEIKLALYKDIRSRTRGGKPEPDVSAKKEPAKKAVKKATPKPDVDEPTVRKVAAPAVDRYPLAPGYKGAAAKRRQDKLHAALVMLAEDGSWDRSDNGRETMDALESVGHVEYAHGGWRLTDKGRDYLDGSAKKVAPSAPKPTAREKVDRARGVAETLAELDQLRERDAAPDILAERIRSAGQQHKLPDSVVDDLVDAAASGDRDRIDAAIDKVAKAHGLRRLGGPAGATEDFDPDVHKPVGSRPVKGAKVLVDSPGYEATIAGATVQVRKAGVFEVAPEAPAKRVTPKPVKIRQLPEAQHRAMDSIAAKVGELEGTNRPVDPDALGVRGTTLDALESSGYVLTTSNMSARRGRAVRLTDKGHDYLAAMRDDQRHRDLNTEIADVEAQAKEADAEASRGNPYAFELAGMLRAKARQLRRERDQRLADVVEAPGGETAPKPDALELAKKASVPKVTAEDLAKERADRARLDSIDGLRQLDAETARDGLDLKTVPQLKELLGQAGLPKSGRKRELVDRLVDHTRPGGKAPDLTGTRGLSADPAVREVQVENRIRQAYNDLPRAPGGWVGLADLRPRLGDDVSREEADAALRKLARQKGVRVAPVDNTKALRERDHVAALELGDSPKHMIAFNRPDGSRVGDPWPPTDLRPLPAAPAGASPKAPTPPRSRTPGRQLPSGADIETVANIRDLTVTQIAQGEHLTLAGRRALDALGPEGHPRIAAIPDTEQKVREAYRMLAVPGGGTDHYVALTDLRKLIGNQTSRTDVDDTLRRMRRMPGVALEAQSYARENFATRIPAAVIIGGQEHNMLHIDDPSLARPSQFAAVNMAQELVNRRTGGARDPMMAELSDADLTAEVNRRIARDPVVARDIAREVPDFATPSRSRTPAASVATATLDRLAADLAAIPAADRRVGGTASPAELVASWRRQLDTGELDPKDLPELFERLTVRYSVKDGDPVGAAFAKAAGDLRQPRGRPSARRSVDPTAAVRASDHWKFQPRDPDLDEPDDDKPELAERAADPEALHHYWTKGEGLDKWAGSPHPWTALYRHLRKYVGSARAKRMAAQWHHEVFGIWPGEKKGQNPVGPG